MNNNFEMVSVPEGKFIMGAPSSDENAEYNEHPEKEIFLSAFQIQKFPVTVKQWTYFLETSRYNWPVNEWKNNCIIFLNQIPDDNFPITYVSWFDCENFIQWLNKNYNNNFSLPTEAQWEKSCRGNKGFLYPWSKIEPDYIKEIENQTNVSIFTIGHNPERKSLYGCLDMWDNISEWCNDWYDEEYYHYGENNNPQGPSLGNYKVFRGGTAFDSGWARCSWRGYQSPTCRHVTLGFRLVTNA